LGWAGPIGVIIKELFAGQASKWRLLSINLKNYILTPSGGLKRLKNKAKLGQNLRQAAIFL
jgi:hypothetical protein